MKMLGNRVTILTNNIFLSKNIIINLAYAKFKLDSIQQESVCYIEFLTQCNLNDTSITMLD